jgi:hypothetical protein
MIFFSTLWYKLIWLIISQILQIHPNKQKFPNFLFEKKMTQFVKKQISYLYK